MIERLLPTLMLALVAPLVGADDDCDALYRSHLETDLELGYEAFDQTMGQGFRVLDAAGCRREAAHLIEAYIEHNNAPQRSLRWHVAQLRAMDGDTPRAIESARSVLLEDEDFTVRALRWNDYVLATIAFLEKDREALLGRRERVAAGVDEHEGNRINLRLLDRLVRNFEHSYADALENSD